MNRRFIQSVTFWFVVLVLLGYSADANEIHVRTHCECPGSVVLLGDIAEVQGDDAQRLQRIELLPAPLPGTVRVLRLAELKRLLALHGVDFQSTRLIGREVQISKSDTPMFIVKRVF